MQTRRGPLWLADADLSAGSDDRPALLAIHGAGGSRLSWPRSIRRIEGWRVLTVDLPGHGRSEGAGRSSTAEYAADLLALLESIQLERVIAIGHSLGGAIALQMALEMPERVAGLILIATGAKLSVRADLLDALHSDPVNAAAALNEMMFGGKTAPELKAANLALLRAAARVLHGDFWAAHMFDVRERLSAIDAPTLVIVGGEDVMTPPAYSQYLQTRLPNAALLQFAGAGHNVHLEQPDAVGAALRSWLANWEPRSPIA
ncbi:MAG: alpha/beta hydrolase [Aggregatilineales bacterium]